jgi:hypothetical protein
MTGENYGEKVKKAKKPQHIGGKEAFLTLLWLIMSNGKNLLVTVPEP